MHIVPWFDVLWDTPWDTIFSWDTAHPEYDFSRWKGLLCFWDTNVFDWDTNVLIGIRIISGGVF